MSKKEESKRYKLLELMKTKSMTSKELAENLGIPIEFAWVYLSQYTRNGKVIIVGKTGRFNLYKAVESNPVELLKQLYNFMGNYLVPLIPKERLNEIPKKLFIKTIKEMVK